MELRCNIRSDRFVRQRTLVVGVTAFNGNRMRARLARTARWGVMPTDCSPPRDWRMRSREAPLFDRLGCLGDANVCKVSQLRPDALMRSAVQQVPMHVSQFVYWNRRSVASKVARCDNLRHAKRRPVRKLADHNSGLEILLVVRNEKETLVKNRILANLLPDDLNALTPHLQRVEIRARSILQEANKPVEYVHFIEHGLVSRVSGGPACSVETAMVGRFGYTGIAIVLGSDFLLAKLRGAPAWDGVAYSGRSAVPHPAEPAAGSRGNAEIRPVPHYAEHPGRSVRQQTRH